MYLILEETPSDEEIDQIISMVDTGQSGGISLSDFIKAITRHSGPLKASDGHGFDTNWENKLGALQESKRVNERRKTLLKIEKAVKREFFPILSISLFWESSRLLVFRGTEKSKAKSRFWQIFSSYSSGSCS